MKASTVSLSFVSFREEKQNIKPELIDSFRPIEGESEEQFLISPPTPEGKYQTTSLLKAPLVANLVCSQETVL